MPLRPTFSDLLPGGGDTDAEKAKPYKTKTDWASEHRISIRCWLGSKKYRTSPGPPVSSE